MAVLFNEAFTGTPGATITVSPGSAFTFIQPAPAYTADAVLGAAAMRCTWTATNATPLGEILQTVATTGYYRFYMKLISTGTLYYFFQTLSNTTARAALSVDTTGALRMRQGTTGLGVASTTKLSTTEWTRIEFGITPTTVQLRMFQGVNLHGTTPTYDSGAVAWTSPGSWDRVRLGSVLTVTNVDVLHDEFAGDSTTWVGPASVPAVTRSGLGSTITTHVATATGVTARRGTAATATTHTVAAAGSKRASGTASTTTAHTTTATGATQRKGTTATTTTHTVTATGQAPTVGARQGAAATTTTTTTTAAGTSAHKGSSRTATAHTITGAGRASFYGAAMVDTFTITRAAGMAPGKRRGITVTAHLGARPTLASIGHRPTTATLTPRTWEGTL